MLLCVLFFKQKTAYEMRISDWSSDVCSSDLQAAERLGHHERAGEPERPPHRAFAGSRAVSVSRTHRVPPVKTGGVVAVACRCMWPALISACLWRITAGRSRSG